MKRVLLSLCILIPLTFIVIFASTSCKGKHPHPGDVLFTDSFSNKNTLYENWEVYDQENTLTGASVWKINEGRLWQTSNIYRGGDDEYKFYEGSNILMRGELDWPDYEFSVDFGISGNGDGVGLLFRYQDEEHYYRLLMVSDTGNKGPFMKLQAKEGNKYHLLAENKKAYDPNHHHRVKVIVAGRNISVIYDDQKIFSVQDDRYKTGRIGMMCYAEQPDFDNVIVTVAKGK